MRFQAGIGATAITLIAVAGAKGGDYGVHEPSRSHFLHRIGPVGGWNPGGGLFHWWDKRCFSQPCGPDDYCRKPFPNVCRYPIAPAWIVPGQPPAPSLTPDPKALR
jgi:hypothetical protein